MSSKFTPSPQQQAFFTWIAEGQGSCVLEAVAGAGKTTTLVHALGMMTGSVFFGAYNKGIAAEIKERVAKLKEPTAQIDVSTMHAAGFRFWRRVARDVRIEATKCRGIFRQASERNPDYKVHEQAVLQLVSLGKQAGLGALCTADEAAWAQLVDHYDIECVPNLDGTSSAGLVIKLAHRLLKESVKLDYSVIDFDDMIYSPLFHGVKVWEHDWVLIDEAQDTNATRRALALRMLKRGGRLVAVGDRHQAIYGFTGADSNALDLIASSVQACRLPLTTTYRCPKAVVAYAQQWVSHIQAADSAPEGSVTQESIIKLVELARPGDAVLCRLSAPLITNVYSFIAAGVPARVEGREIADGLKALAQRWKIKHITALDKRLEGYLEAETGKLRAKEKESKAVALEDKVSCLRVIMKRVVDRLGSAGVVTDVVAEIDALFGDDGSRKPVVLFSTIHKSKGREWDRVVWIATGPSPWARKDWEVQQETNLCYVAATRAKSELVVVA